MSEAINDLLPPYAELQCLSNFSFLRGASQPAELVRRAAALGYAALALADECSVAGVVRAHVEAKKQGLDFIVGSQFAVQDERGRVVFTLILLAQDREGYGNLCELITHARTRGGVEKGSYVVRLADFTAPGAEFAHLRGMPGCLALLAPRHRIEAAELQSQARWLRAAFPRRGWLALTLLMKSGDEQHRAAVEAAAAAAGVPIVATGDVCMHVRSKKPLQDVMTAIRLGKTVAECGFALAPNAEQRMRSRLRLARLYPRAALEESVRIAELCEFSLDELRYEYPDELVPVGETAASYLRRETYAGARRRYPAGIPKTVAATLEHELGLIRELEYEAYFLTVYDIVRFAREREILCQGRGSAANSAVCYCLGITEVNPADSNLLFERFLSKERNEPPDIDVDFEHQRREEVIQYIYGKYGRRRAALTAVVISYQLRSVVRDVGKALGIDAEIVDKVAKSHRWWDGRAAMVERFAEYGLDPASQVAHDWMKIGTELWSFPRHLSQHPGGFVMARGKLTRLVPVENAAMENRSVVQWDKDDLDALGLLKVDVLALGMLSMIRRALDFISVRRGMYFDMQSVPREDPATYEMIQRADTVGVFQIESRAQMSMLPRLKPKNFYDLVIEVAIVRPGPIQGGMVHPYLRRRQGLEPVTYQSPAVEKTLGRTLGVPIFQEQVMQLAIDAAGFTPGEADELRRAMAAWKRRGNIEKYQQKLMQGLLDNGYPEDFAVRITKQVEGFGEYGFPESHAASFALLAYVSSWLKRHEPAAFLAALLNSQPMGFYTPWQLVQDARRHGVEVRAVDIMHSGWDAALEEEEGSEPAVRLGLNMVGGLAEDVARRIEAARIERPFASVRDLALRAGLERRELELLAGADALKVLAGNRHEALWTAVTAAPDKALLREAPQPEETFALPPPTEAAGILADIDTTGLTLQRHPLALVRPALTKRRFSAAEVLQRFADGQFARGCGIVTVRQRPQTAKGVTFITLEDETGSVNVIVWPTMFDRFRPVLLNAKLLGVYGIWQSKDGVSHLVGKHFVDVSPLIGRLETHSRDFA